MFHLHHLFFFPFFVLFHVVGFVLLFIGAVVLMKVFRRGRAGLCAKRTMSNAGNSGSSENRAFDDYRQATVRRLELEAEEFRKYLDGLRRAADATAFEAFLKSRRTESGPAT